MSVIDKSFIEVVIPNSITSIETLAFSECRLESVYIPNSVSCIEEGAFNGCNSLRNIYIPCKDIDKIKVHNAFEDINFNECVLHIPYGTRVLYRSHPVFRQFKNIVSEIFE